LFNRASGHCSVFGSLAPSAPIKVFATSNVTDSIMVRWAEPTVVHHRIDRYYVRYQAITKPLSDEIIIEDIINSQDFYEVSSLSVYSR